MARRVVKVRNPRHANGTLASARMGAGNNPAARTAHLMHMKRITGQVEGIRRMIEEERYCADIIVQITAARASLQSVAKALLSEHLRTCTKAAIRDGGGASDAMYQELVELVSKMAR